MVHSHELSTTIFSDINKIAQWLIVQDGDQCSSKPNIHVQLQNSQNDGENCAINQSKKKKKNILCPFSGLKLHEQF